MMNDKMKYMLGANYWGRRFGTEMWLHYDGAEIRSEMKQLRDWGVRVLRVFPNWRDFQPVDRAYAWKGTHGEYVHSRTGEVVVGDGVDEEAIECFRDFCRAAEENDVKLVVSIVTGWMSGRLFFPPVLAGKNLISDPEALTWMRRYIHRFVRELKNEKAIIMWDLGNECNCLGDIKNEFDAYVWTNTVADSIRCEDNSRPISSGMHSLQSGGDLGWQIETQGELCDLMPTHPYPSPTVGGDVEPYTRLGMTYLPTAQSLYYSGVGGKPAYIQESGVFTESIGSREMAANFMRIQILSSLTNNLLGYQWWCAWEQKHLNFAPYNWAMIERELGLFDKDNNPKPVAFVMRAMSKLIDKLDGKMPNRVSDGVCVLSRGQNRQNVAIASQIFGKQAGVSLDVAYSDSGNIPKSNLYFMPAVTGWQVIYKKTWETLIERVKEGATLCVSYAGGYITEFPEIIGAKSNGVMANTCHSFELDGERLEYHGKEILLTPTTAEVLAKNESGNPVLLRNKIGKGEFYFVNFAPENIAFETADGFNTSSYYKIYKTISKKFVDQKPIKVNDSNLFVTENPEDGGSVIVSVLNYSDEAIVPNIEVASGWEITEIIYGNTEELPACDGVIFRIKQKA